MLNCLIAYHVKSRTVQSYLHLIRIIIKSIIKPCWSMLSPIQVTIFLLTILSAQGFKLVFNSWIRLLYATHNVKVERVKIEAFHIPYLTAVHFCQCNTFLHWNLSCARWEWTWPYVELCYLVLQTQLCNTCKPTNNVEFEKVRKENRLYEPIVVVMVNKDKSVYIEYHDPSV